MYTLFGTDGIRGNLATSPYLSTPFLHQLGKALCSWLSHKGIEHPVFLFGHDTRASAHHIMHALACGLKKEGVTLINAGIVSTPMLQHLVSRFSSTYHCAIMITASHNGGTDNGIKLLSPSGKLSREDEMMIELFVEHTPQVTACSFNPDIKPLPTLHATSYFSHISRLIPSNMLEGMHVVLDCGNGATYQLAPALFSCCKARVTVMGTQPDGTNANTGGSQHPQALQETVLTHNADIGFAFDADGDRVVAVTAQGELKRGEQLLAFLSLHPLFAHQSHIVSTHAANTGFENWLIARGKSLARTDVGDRAVHTLMSTLHAQLGGEPSGHIILHPHLPSSDGVLAALFLASTLRITGNTDMTTFIPVPQAHVTIPAHYAENLTLEPFASIIRSHEIAVFPGRILVRFSGTEPLVRIMVEHEDAAVALHHAGLLAHQLEPLLNLYYRAGASYDIRLVQ